MDGWLQWGLGIVITLILGAIAYYIKRLIAKNDERQKDNEDALQKRMDCMESNLSDQIGRIQQTLEDRIDKGDQAMKAEIEKGDMRTEKLENRLNDLIKELPRGYVDKESWMVQNQRIDRKLDRITEILMGRAQQNG